MPAPISLNEVSARDPIRREPLGNILHYSLLYPRNNIVLRYIKGSEGDSSPAGSRWVGQRAERSSSIGHRHSAAWATSKRAASRNLCSTRSIRVAGRLTVRKVASARGLDRHQITRRI